MYDIHVNSFFIMGNIKHTVKIKLYQASILRLFLNSFKNTCVVIASHLNEILYFRYDPVTGLSNIQFDLIHNKNLTPLDIARLSSIVAQIMSNRLPLNVNGQQVLWLDTANLTVTEDDGTIITGRFYNSYEKKAYTQ